MAKGKRSATKSAEAIPSMPDNYQAREDVSDLMRPMALRGDKVRHAKALDMMKKTLDHETSRVKVPRGRSRAGRKTSARNIGRR